MPEIMRVQAQETHFLKRVRPSGLTPEVATPQERAPLAEEHETVFCLVDEQYEVLDQRGDDD
ncbi:hypothetical protein [Nonomuraea sp. NPDC003709]|uniref:hypothetical protein n=1 Tax=Nonomuraea sp. NPDC003709 TaxID=3154450 RepID=UPI0033B97DE2